MANNWDYRIEGIVRYNINPAFHWENSWNSKGSGPAGLQTRSPGPTEHTRIMWHRISLTTQPYNRMNEMILWNASNDPTETASLTQRGLDIVHLLERSYDDQSDGPDHNSLENIDMEGHHIHTIDLINDAIMHVDYVGNHVPTKHYTGNTLKSCESAHGTDST